MSKLSVCQKMTFYSDQVPTLRCSFLPFHSGSAFPFNGGWREQYKSGCAASAQIQVYSICVDIVQHLKKTNKQNKNQIHLNVIQLPFSLCFSAINRLLVVSH